MFKALKKKLKDQRGMTLIELLAVVVILGIIAAIAVPSIGGIINNSKKDAHIANVQQLANAAKLYVAANNTNVTTTGTDLTITMLQDGGFLDKVKNPSGGDYNPATTMVTVKKSAADSNKLVYLVDLVSGTGTGAVTYVTDADPNGTFTIANY
jgi:type IV pilus assembly protein PilA